MTEILQVLRRFTQLTVKFARKKVKDSVCFEKRWLFAGLVGKTSGEHALARFYQDRQRAGHRAALMPRFSEVGTVPARAALGDHAQGPSVVLLHPTKMVKILTVG